MFKILCCTSIVLFAFAIYACIKVGSDSEKNLYDKIR